jgi:hypothetical protein
MLTYRERATFPMGHSRYDVVIMSANSSLEEVQAELAKLKIAYEVLEKSHRRLIAKVITDRSEADHFAGQMVIDRTILTPSWLKGR